MINIPTFSGTPTEQISACVKWVEAALPNSVGATGLLDLGNRTTNQILKSGKVLSSFGCLDKSTVIGSVLKQNGFEVHIIGEKVTRNSRPIGMHFSLECKKQDQKFTIDPHTTRTEVVSGWRPDIREGKITRPFEGGREVKFQRVLRSQIPADSLNLTAFQVAGLKGKRDYMRVSQTPLKRYLKLIASRVSPTDTMRLNKIKKKRAQRLSKK